MKIKFVLFVLILSVLGCTGESGVLEDISLDKDEEHFPWMRQDPTKDLAKRVAILEGQLAGKATKLEDRVYRRPQAMSTDFGPLNVPALCDPGDTAIGGSCTFVENNPNEYVDLEGFDYVTDNADYPTGYICKWYNGGEGNTVKTTVTCLAAD